jgi:tetratricopeptide (TPR) repeat protein
MEITVGLRGGTGAGDGSTLFHSAPMVGRDLQAQRILAAFRDTVYRGKCSAVLVHGPSGAGKSRLVAETLVTLEGEGRAFRLLECRGGEEGPLAYLAQLLRSRFKDEIAAEQPARALVASLRELVPTHEVVEVSVAVAVLVGIELPGGHASLTSLRELLEDPARRQPFVVDILNRLFRRETERAPVILRLHDPDAADPESRAILADALAVLADVPLFVVAEQEEAQRTAVSGPRRFIRATTSPGADKTGIDLPALAHHSESSMPARRPSDGTPDLDPTLLRTEEASPWDQLGSLSRDLDELDADATHVIDRPAALRPQPEARFFGMPCEQIAVLPLTDLQMESLVRKALRTVPDAPDALVSMLLTAAAGLPSGLEQGLVALVSHQVIEQTESGVWAVRMDRLMSDALPSDLEQLSLSRLRALPAKHRHILELASVVGSQFRVSEVLALMRVDEEHGEIPFFEARTESRLRRILLDVQGRDIVVFEPDEGHTGDEVFRFRFQRERELLGAAVPERRREILHRVLAQVLERSGASPGRIVAHWRAGNAQRRASITLLRAGIGAANAFQVRAAVEYLEEAVAKLGIDEGEELFDGLASLANCYLTLGDFDRVDATCKTLAQYAYAMSTPRYGARCFLMRGTAGRHRGEMEEGFAHLERALELARREPDGPEIQAMIAEVLDEMVTNRWSGGAHFSEALKIADEALKVRRAMGDTAGTAQTLLYIGQIQYARRRAADAKNCFEQAEKLAREEGLTPVLARARNALGITAYFQRDFDRANAYWSEVLEMSQQLGDRFLRAAVLNNLGEMAFRRGAVRQSADYLQRAVDLGRSIGEHRVVADALRHLSQIALGETALDQAVAYGRQALDEARRSGVRMSVARALRNLGEVWGHTLFQEAFPNAPGVATQVAATRMSLMERAMEAERSFQESMALLEAMGDQTELRQTYKSYARFLRERGRADEAAELESQLDATEMYRPG